MAWRSSGSTNNEMVNNLKRFGVISSMPVEEGFRNVDRVFFVPRNRQDMAYADQPLKEGNIHLSAPHIYGSVLEALELRKNESLSFLNAGAGSGYLTCLAASMLGPRSSHYCVEIHQDVIDHCREAIANWKEHYLPAQDISHIDVIRGNALEIDLEKGESALGYDRIYIGAAIGKESLDRFKKLLKPGGILVGPVEDELMKIVRSQTPPEQATERDFSHQVLSGVRFAPLIPYPSIETIIPARIWNPAVHKYFPESFQNSCKELLLCSNAKYEQPEIYKPKKKVNTASMLPRALWMEILSFTHRDWFKAPESEVEFLRRRLREEQANAERANLARLEAETRCHLADRERDVYQLLARRWKARLNSHLGGEQRSETDAIEEAAAAMLSGNSHNVSIFGLLRRFQSQMEDDNNEEEVDDEDEENDDDEEEYILEQHRDEDDAMDEDESESNEGMEERDELPGPQVSTRASTSKSIVSRPRTVSTVSIAPEDW